MKRLVVCFDGTWNDADNQAADTNVARIARSIHASQETDGVLQCVLYVRGVGTSGLDTEVIVEGATGLGLDDNIRSGYMFLAQNYLPGDEIFLFGFSRGAFTARSITGLLCACGLLKRQQLGHLGRAWTYYRTPKPHSPADFNSWAKTDSHADVRVKFLGVWDTVGALGIPGALFSMANHDHYGFHDTGPSPVIEHGCHALAVDEHRSDFVPTLWTGAPVPGTTIEQVWFAGAHADVGGGYATRSLADIPLVWMAQKAETDGLALDWNCLPDKGKLQPLGPRHDSRTGVFIKDKLLPTLRRVCQRDVHVPFNERLYVPMENGLVQPTLNEALSPSMIERIGKQAPLCKSDTTGSCTNEEYLPRNVPSDLVAQTPCPAPC